MTYNFEAGEWYGTCKACNTELFAPTKKKYNWQHRRHTRSINCLNGY